PTTTEAPTTTEVPTTTEAPTTEDPATTTEASSETTKAEEKTTTTKAKDPSTTTTSALAGKSSNKPKKPSGKQKAGVKGLPSTGEESGFTLSLLGLAAVSVTGLLYYRKSRN
uniref:LPXTG cell wall anchor domain-containing protein n=1 Tax=Streptococcus orisasini TaxID=1080071 RepID=UPI000A42E2C1